MKLVVGTYGPRMRWLELDDADFSVRASEAVAADNTSYLALSPDRRYLFAVSESGDASKLYSFRLAGQPFRQSEVGDIAPDPCHLLYVPGYFNHCGDPDNGALLTADYSGGSISLYPVRGGDIEPAAQVVRFEGHGPDPERQLAPHIHHLALFGHLLLAVDLGADCIHVLRMFDGSVRPLCDGRLDRALRLERLFDVPAPAGSGPRHLAVDKSGSHFYVLTELSNEILVYAMPDFTNPDDRPVLLQRLPVGDPACLEQAGGDLQLSPDGRHLYASLRNGDDGLVVAEIQSDGSLRRVGYQRTGAHVRDFYFLSEGCGPAGEHMAVFCKNSRCLQFYRRRPADGSLSLVQEIPFDDTFGEPVHGVLLEP